MNIDITLTTACYDLTKFNPDGRNLSDCVNNMKALLEVPCYLVIYCDSKTYPFIKEIRDTYKFENLTYYIVDDFEKTELFKYNELIKKNRLTYHPTKDKRTCSESHILCCSKFNFVLETMDIDPFNTSKFGWIDANIGNNFSKICENYTNNMLLYVLKNISDKFHIQILNVCDKKYKENCNKREYYNQYRWVACGCLFTTGKIIGKKILKRLNELFIETTNLGYGYGEEMLYLEVIDDFNEDIKISYGDYSNILNNFITPTKNYNYINNCIVQGYLKHGYNKECYDCCKCLLNEIEKYKVPIDYSIYFSLLFSLYISSYYYKINEAKCVVEHIMELVNKNPYIKAEFEKSKPFYLTQFSFVEK